MLVNESFGRHSQRRHGAVAVVLAHIRAHLDAVRDETSGPTPGLTTPVGLLLPALGVPFACHGSYVPAPRVASGDSSARNAEGDAERIVEELVDVGEARAIAHVVRIGAEIVVRIHFAADVEHHRTAGRTRADASCAGRSCRRDPGPTSCASGVL